MSLTNSLGFAATIISSVMLLPQLLKTRQTKSAKDFSIYMLLMGSFSNLNWLIYGISLNATPNNH